MQQFQEADHLPAQSAEAGHAIDQRDDAPDLCFIGLADSEPNSGAVGIIRLIREAPGPPWRAPGCRHPDSLEAVIEHEATALVGDGLEPLRDATRMLSFRQQQDELETIGPHGVQEEPRVRLALRLPISAPTGGHLGLELHRKLRHDRHGSLRRKGTSNVPDIALRDVTKNVLHDAGLVHIDAHQNTPPNAAGLQLPLQGSEVTDCSIGDVGNAVALRAELHSRRGGAARRSAEETQPETQGLQHCTCIRRSIIGLIRDRERKERNLQANRKAILEHSIEIIKSGSGKLKEVPARSASAAAELGLATWRG